VELKNVYVHGVSKNCTNYYKQPSNYDTIGLVCI